MGGATDRQGLEVVANDLGAEVLLGGELGDPGQMLQGQSMLDALEGFLNAPAGVEQIAKVRGGIVTDAPQCDAAGWY